MHTKAVYDALDCIQRPAVPRAPCHHTATCDACVLQLSKIRLNKLEVKVTITKALVCLQLPADITFPLRQVTLTLMDSPGELSKKVVCHATDCTLHCAFIRRS